MPQMSERDLLLGGQREAMHRCHYRNTFFAAARIVSPGSMGRGWFWIGAFHKLCIVVTTSALSMGRVYSFSLLLRAASINHSCAGGIERQEATSGPLNT